MRRDILYPCVCLVTLCAGFGCGSGNATVNGEVLLDGTPVENGTITFEPADLKGPTFGGPIVKGHYEVTGAPGKKNVFVTSFRLTGKKIPANQPGMPPYLVDEMRVFPPQGKSHEPKEVELASGENSFSVQLTSPAGDEAPARAPAEAQTGPGPPR